MAIEALYVFSTGLVKVSILLFYRRLVTGTVSISFKWAVRGCIFSVAAYMITFETTLIFGCRPISSYWNEVDPLWRVMHTGTYMCLNEPATLFAANITSILQDFLTFLMPLLLFQKLQLPPRQKFLLGAVFSVGFL
jgi:rhodopsin domain-containing protein